MNYASNVEDCPIAKKAGRPSVLKPDEEKLILDWIQKMASVGFPITNKELLDSIQHCLNRANRITAFENNRPTLQWIPRFKKRHNLSLRVPENLDIGKALVTPVDLRKWSDRVEAHLKLVIIAFTCTYPVLRPL